MADNQSGVSALTGPPESIGLLDMPVEILVAISDKAPLGTVWRLRQVCRAFMDIFDDQFERRLHAAVPRPPIEETSGREKSWSESGSDTGDIADKNDDNVDHTGVSDRIWDMGDLAFGVAFETWRDVGNMIIAGIDRRLGRITLRDFLRDPCLTMANLSIQASKFRAIVKSAFRPFAVSSLSEGVNPLAFTSKADHPDTILYLLFAATITHGHSRAFGQKVLDAMYSCPDDDAVLGAFQRMTRTRFPFLYNSDSTFVKKIVFISVAPYGDDIDLDRTPLSLSDILRGALAKGRFSLATRLWTTLVAPNLEDALMPSLDADPRETNRDRAFAMLGFAVHRGRSRRNKKVDWQVSRQDCLDWALSSGVSGDLAGCFGTGMCTADDLAQEAINLVS